MCGEDFWIVVAESEGFDPFDVGVLIRDLCQPRFYQLLSMYKRGGDKERHQYL